jgi:DNA-binding IclR family transcriptional regulator
MNFQRLGVVLTAVNLGLLLFVLGALAQIRPTVAAQDVAPVLRGRALQIVDEQGRVRASLNVSAPRSRAQD